jgi:hypothetical protein
MTDLHDRFRSLDRIRPPDLWSEALQRAAAADMARPAGPWGMNRGLAIALALVALLIITIGIAVVGGLLRIDRNDPDDANPFALAGPVAQSCDSTLAEGLVLAVNGYGPGESWEDISELHAYQDGLVVIGPSAYAGGSANTLEASWSQRRLAADGVAHLVEAVTGSLPSCRSFEFEGSMGVQARTGDEVVVIHLGTSPFETRVTTPAEAAAVDAFVQRLEDPDLGLAAADWADPDWHPYVPQLWRFSVQFQAGPTDRGYPSADSLVLPDGSTLSTFGVEEPIADRDPSGTSGVSMLRCGFVDEEEARAIAAVLTDAGGRPPDTPAFGWYFTTDTTTGGGTLFVNAVGLLPHEFEQDCLTAIVGPEPSPSPEPASSPPATGPVPFADACDYVPGSLIEEVIAPLDGEIEHMPDWNPDWAMCWHPVAQDGLPIFASRRSIPADRATEQATILFGEGGFRVDQIGGHDVFFSTCDPSAEQCRAAVAISAEPHFVVITWGSEAHLRQLAEGLTQLLVAGT